MAFINPEELKKKALEFYNKIFSKFLRAGAEALPLPKPSQVAKKIQEKYPTAIERGREIGLKAGFKPLEEEEKLPETQAGKIAYTAGAVTSQIGQFVGAGKVADLILGVGFKALKYKNYATKIGVSTKQIFDAERKLGFSFKAIPDAWLKGAAQWGLYALPRLKGETPLEKTRELATDMVTGGAFGMIGANKELLPVVRYFAGILAPYIIKSQIGGKPEEAKEEAKYYAALGLPFLAFGGIKAVKGQRALTLPGKTSPPTGIVPKDVISPQQAIEKSRTLLEAPKLTEAQKVGLSQKQITQAEAELAEKRAPKPAEQAGFEGTPLAAAVETPIEAALKPKPKITDYKTAKDFAEAELGAKPTNQIGEVEASRITPRDPVDKNSVPYKDLKADIEKRGISEPIRVTVEGDKIITTEGSNRVTIAQELGIKVPVIVNKGEIKGLKTIEEMFDKAVVKPPTKPKPIKPETTAEVAERVALKRKLVSEKVKFPERTTLAQLKSYLTTLDEVRDAIGSGDEVAAKAIWDTIKGRKQSFEALVAEVEGVQKQQLGGFDEIKAKFGDYEKQVKQHMNILRIAGEKISKKTGELLREHIPASKTVISSDELADVMGMSENEYMAYIGEKAGIGGDIAKKLKPIVKIKVQKQHKAIKKWFVKLPPKQKELLKGLDKKAFKVVPRELGEPITLGRVPSIKPSKLAPTARAVLAKPTKATKAKIKERKLKARLETVDQAFKEWQETYKTGTFTTRQQLNKALTQAKQLTDKGVRERIAKETARIFAPDYRTPEYVLERLGLKEKVYTPLKTGQEKVAKKLLEETVKMNRWYKKAGKTKKIRDKIGRALDGQINPSDLSKNELEVYKEVKPSYVEWADLLGLPKEKRIANYLTRLFKPDFEEGKRVFPDELARILDYVTPNKEFNPFLEKRTGAKGYKLDYLEAYEAYVYRGARKLYLDKALGEAAKLVDYLPLQASRYVDKFLKNFKNRPSDFEKWLDQNFIQGLSPKVKNSLGNRPAKRLTNLITGQIYRGTLGFNLGSALKNLTQFVNTYAELGEKYTAIGYTQLITKGIDELKKEVVLSDMVVSEHKNTSFRKGLKKMDSALFWFFETAEKINRGSAYYGAKQKFLDEAALIKPGDTILGIKIAKNEIISPELINEKAIEYAKAMVRKTQFAYGKLDTPLSLQSPAGKLAFTLATYPLKQFEFIGGYAKRREWRKLFRYIASSFAIVALVGDYLGIDYKDVFAKNIMPTLGIVPQTFKKITSGKEWEREKAIKNIAKILLIPGYGGLKKLGKAIEGESRTAPSKRFPKGQRRFKIDTPKAIIQTILTGEWSTAEAEKYLIKKGLKDEPGAWIDDLLYIITGERKYAPRK